MHFSETATRLFGLAEVLGGIGILVPRTRNLALSGLVLLMTGAIGIHVGAGHPPAVATFASIGWVLYSTLFVVSGRRALLSLFFRATRETSA